MIDPDAATTGDHAWARSRGSQRATASRPTRGPKVVRAPATPATTAIVRIAWRMPQHYAAAWPPMAVASPDGRRVVAHFGECRRDQADLAEVEADIASTVRDTLRPDTVALWVRSKSEG